MVTKKIQKTRKYLTEVTGHHENMVSEKKLHCKIKIYFTLILNQNQKYKHEV